MDSVGRARELPLAGVRVLDLADGGAEMTARLFADLGADVIRVEPPEGVSSRWGSAGVSLSEETRNANKRAVALDLGTAEGREAYLRLADTAGIVVVTARSGELEQVGCGPDDLLARRPDLVVVSVTDFGRNGPYRDWAASEWVHLALGGVLSRSGLPGRPPLLPPGSLASESAAIQAAWVALAAYENRLRTGVGDLVDVSVYESVVQVLDPGYGITGSALAGAAAFKMPRGRPDARHLYPIFPCMDGLVRICVLSGRQWQGLFRWLGEPAEFADPALATLRARFAAVGRIYPAVGRLFATRTRDQIMVESQKFGVPAAALLTPHEVLDCEHFRARGAFTDLPLADGRTARVSDGFVELDGCRAGIRTAAPEHGQHTAEVLAELDSRTPPKPALPALEAVTAVPGRPFAGLRVLDLGVIVVGAEIGRLFADLGAEVVKVENRAFPDGSRQSLTGAVMSVGVAYGHRNKLSLGLNLRTPEGAALFRRLVAHSDVVLSNFKPGTMESLGLGYEDLAAVNPRIVVADSSAFGPTGPWAERLGYGPLVRASTGLTGLWRYPDDPDGYSDASTIYPDHIAARVSATAVLAMLIARRRTGRGGRVSVAQAEVILGQLSHQLALESLEPGHLAALGNTGPDDAPKGLYPCAGDDEWCVVTVRDDDDWTRLVGVLGDPELADARLATAAARVAHRAEIDEAVGNWTQKRPPRDAVAELQDAGVPAGMMQRVTDFPEDPHLTARSFFRTLDHPFLDAPLPTENGPALSRALADPPLRPAPLLGADSREVLQRVLDLTADEIDRLIADGIVEEPVPAS